MKIFRDLIWTMRGLMKADHQFYKSRGLYDFPQKRPGRMLAMCLLGAMMRRSKNSAKMKERFNRGMMAPYEKLLERVRPTK